MLSIERALAHDVVSGHVPERASHGGTRAGPRVPWNREAVHRCAQRSGLTRNEVEREKGTPDVNLGNVPEDGNQSQASVRRFASMFAEKVSALSIVGEPATPSVDATCERLATRAYVDLATCKTHLVQAGQLFRLGQWKPAAGMMRNAIEQLVDDVFAHVAPAAGLSGTNVHDKVNGLCRHWGCGEVARYVYGTYALLSDVGSHPGDVEASRGERAWHAAIVALGEFTDRLP